MAVLLTFWTAACTGAFLAAADVSPNQSWRQAFAATIVALHLVFYMWVLPHVPVEGNRSLVQVLLRDTVFERSEVTFYHNVINLSVIFWFPLQAAFALALCLDADNEGVWWALAVTQAFALGLFAIDTYQRRKETFN